MLHVTGNAAVFIVACVQVGSELRCLGRPLTLHSRGATSTTWKLGAAEEVVLVELGAGWRHAAAWHETGDMLYAALSI